MKVACCPLFVTLPQGRKVADAVEGNTCPGVFSCVWHPAGFGSQGPPIFYRWIVTLIKRGEIRMAHWVKDLFRLLKRPYSEDLIAELEARISALEEKMRDGGFIYRVTEGLADQYELDALNLKLFELKEHVPEKFFRAEAKTVWATNEYRVEPAAAKRQTWEIIVPGMLVKLVSGQRTCAQGGFFKVEVLGAKRVISVRRRELERFGNHELPEAVIEQNRTRWRERVSRFNRFQKNEEYLLVGDQVMLESDARIRLACGARELYRAMQRHGLNEVVQGHIVGLVRLMRQMRGHPRGHNLEPIIELVAAELPDRAALEGAMARIIEWAGADVTLDPPRSKTDQEWPPRQKGDLPFIDAPVFKRPRLAEMYAAAGLFEPGFTYTRAQVEKLVSGCASSGAPNDPRFPLEVLIRNMVDIGYLERDVRGLRYWLRIGPWCESMPANAWPEPETRKEHLAT